MPKRLPRNAAPIPFPSAGRPNTFLSTSPASCHPDQFQSLGQWSDQVDIPTRSPSAYSEIEVVLDDGTLQKRTVSLSTVPEPLSPQHEDFATQESGDEAAAAAAATTTQRHEHSRETTPLLQGGGGETTYRAVSGGSSESSASTTESDSDTPFFPASGKKKHTHYSPLPSDNNNNSSSSLWARARSRIGRWKLSNAQRQVLKCSFAYFLGSLFTFVPAFNALIGNNRVSSHLVATATVFFNPAKSLGGMVEAAAYGWGYTLSATAVCLGSMVTTDYFIDRGYDAVAHALALLVWLAGPTVVIAFLKAHWNKPPVATASSLCFIIIFIVVVREGSANRGDFDTTRIEQIVSAVATGTVITVSCCIIFWPYSAAKKLNNDLEATLSSYQVLLKLLTKTFLLDDDLPEFKANKTLQTAIDSHRASFTSLRKSLSDARLEVMWNRQIRGRVGEYEDIVKSMQRLAQHVGGLRSSCGIQFERMSTEHQGSWKRAKKRLRTRAGGDETWSVRAGYRRKLLESEMRRQKTIEMDAAAADGAESAAAAASSGPADMARSPSHDHPSDAELETESTTLLEFIRTIRQPLKSLAYTSKQTLHHLRFVFSPSTTPRKPSSPSYQTLAANLEKAIALFEMSQLQAVQKAHQQRMQKKLKGSDAPGDDLYLVYFFVFNMVEFAREMITLVECIRRWSEAQERTRHIHWWQFKAWSGKRANDKPDTKKDVSINNFVPNERNRMNTLHTPQPKTAWRRFFLRTWRTLSLLRQQKVRYAIKCSVAATLLATPAFIASTTSWFRTWRMEWALITLMVVMTPTVGGTNLVSVYRILSTVLGCCTAMIFYMLFPSNIYVLPLLTWLFSIPNFWMILHHKHGKFGQFTLLAYNLVMLNKYNDRDTNNVEVWLLALQRCAAILVGVVFGLVATVYVWPYEARVELRKGLSDFLLRLAWLYQKLVSVYSGRPLLVGDSDTDLTTKSSNGHRHHHPEQPTTAMITTLPQRAVAKRTFMDMELDMQRALLELQALLAQTPNEPRLKGAFPVDTYRAMLTSCQNIVDKFCAMRTVIFKDAWFDDVQRDFIIPVNQARREMVGNVLLYFYLLASALRLKTPLPPYFPPARNAWQSLMTHLRELPVVQSRSMLEKEHVYVLYYAYVTMMEDIIRELDKLGACMTSLFGELVPANEWDGLFSGYDPEQQTLLGST